MHPVSRLLSYTRILYPPLHIPIKDAPRLAPPLLYPYPIPPRYLSLLKMHPVSRREHATLVHIESESIHPPEALHPLGDRLHPQVGLRMGLHPQVGLRMGLGQA